MKWGFVCLAIFAACELVGAWQNWQHLMVIGGGWLVFGVVLLFTSKKRNSV